MAKRNSKTALKESVDPTAAATLDKLAAASGLSRGRVLDGLIMGARRTSQVWAYVPSTGDVRAVEIPREREDNTQRLVQYLKENSNVG